MNNGKNTFLTPENYQRVREYAKSQGLYLYEALDYILGEIKKNIKKYYKLPYIKINDRKKAKIVRTSIKLTEASKQNERVVNTCLHYYFKEMEGENA